MAIPELIQMINNFNTPLFARAIKLVLLMLFIISPHSAVAIEFKQDVTQEEIDKYKAAIVIFISDTKGWKPEEYRIRFSGKLNDAPLAIFQVTRYDVMDEIRKFDALGRHPTGELEVYVKTDELRAFADYEESIRIWQKAKTNKADKAGGRPSPH